MFGEGTLAVSVDLPLGLVIDLPFALSVGETARLPAEATDATHSYSYAQPNGERSTVINRAAPVVAEHVKCNCFRASFHLP